MGRGLGRWAMPAELQGGDGDDGVCKNRAHPYLLSPLVSSQSLFWTFLLALVVIENLLEKH